MTDKRTFGSPNGEIRLAWTPDRIERLIELWRAGYSAGAIAAMMGGTSREAVCGKIWRLSRTVPGLQRVEPTNIKYYHVAAKITRKIRDGRKAQDRPQEGSERAPNFSATPLPPEPPPPPRMVSLADLDAGQCRFPFGDPKTAEFGFCGCPSMPGQSYCAAHHKLCFTAYTPRRAIQTSEVNHRIIKALHIVEEGVE
ncbi:MAG: GcrA family cell cycle regulator [Pirellulales bacterium]